MRDLRDLGLGFHGEPITTPPPTDRQLALVERLVGVPLPAAYVEFLRFSNGGYPKLNTFYIEREGKREPWTIDHFFSVASDSLVTEDVEDVVWEHQHCCTGAPREFLPIADDGMGNKLFLDLTEEGGGQVIFWVHDEDWPLFPVAGSFEDFIDSLTTYPEDVEALAKLPES